MRKLVSSFVLVALLVGCATTAEKNAYNTVATITATTNGAIEAYGEYLKTHTITEQERQTALRALETYNTAIIEAQKVVTQFKVGNASQNQVDLVIQVSAAASNALLNIIKPYIVK